MKAGDCIPLNRIRFPRFTKKCHQCTVGTVAADNAAAARDGAVIHTNTGDNMGNQCIPHFRKPMKGFPAACGKLNHRKPALCNRTGLIAEQQAQASGGFKAVNFTDKYIILCHFQALERKQD